MSSCSASSALKPEMFSTLSLDFVEALLSVTWCFLRPSMLATNSIIAWFASPSRAGALIDMPTLSFSRETPQACKSHRLVPPICLTTRCESSLLISGNQGSESVTFAPGLARTARLQPSPAVFRYGGRGLVGGGAAVFVGLKQVLFFMHAQVTCIRKPACLCCAITSTCGDLMRKRRNCILIQCTFFSHLHLHWGRPRDSPFIKCQWQVGARGVQRFSCARKTEVMPFGSREG